MTTVKESWSFGFAVKMGPKNEDVILWYGKNGNSVSTKTEPAPACCKVSLCMVAQPGQAVTDIVE